MISLLLAWLFGKHVPPSVRVGMIAIGVAFLIWRVHKVVKKFKQEDALAAKPLPKASSPPVSPPVATPTAPPQAASAAAPKPAPAMAGFNYYSVFP